ncbi:MAG: hypothetical protein A3C43_05785 [Candidatus Schekmanbacteria bacterium RIFCSPHIGHO2_02_FULL_38_11]|nr:MAG: hypothetical protein A3C43_05785 [Candidatus Schekmanbacteria bacterium RIFCSPHIGHO2_02_FULL_38_11]
MRKVKSVLVLYVGIILVLLFISNSFAATFNVKNISEFRQALENAAVNGEDDTIILDAGTYKTTDDGIGTFKFSDTEAYNLTIKAKDGLTYNYVILDGGNIHQVLNYINTKAATFTIDSITVKNGKASGYRSGGIYSGGYSSSITVTNSTISGNSGGSGIYSGGDGSVTVTNSIISENSGGSGIYGGNSVTITNSTISGNTNNGDKSYNGKGGGIYSGGGVTVTNSIISGNTVQDYYIDNGNGGGIYSGGSVTVTNSIISENRAYDDGGGIYGGGDGGVTVTNSIISGNDASFGGGYNVNDGGGIYSGGGVTVTNSIISENRAYSSYPFDYGYGGGIYSGGDGGVTVTNSIISGNTDNGYYSYNGHGGGIYGKGNFINNIFADNSSDIYFGGNSNVYNNYIDYTNLLNESSYVIIKKDNIQPSAGNLNFTDSDFRLGAGSVAIDKGLDPNSDIFKGLFTTDSNLLAKVLNSLQSDKDGNQRIAGIAIDLGAYEYGSIPTTTTTTTTTSTTTTSTDAGTTTSTSTTTTTSSTTTTTIPCSNKSPEISGISPTKGTYADEITISGIDFCGEEGIVYFARLGTKKMADVESWNDDEIVVSVPWELKQGIYKVKVATALGNESNQIPFKFLKPIPHITGLSI